MLSVIAGALPVTLPALVGAVPRSFSPPRDRRVHSFLAHTFLGLWARKILAPKFLALKFLALKFLVHGLLVDQLLVCIRADIMPCERSRLV